MTPSPDLSSLIVRVEGATEGSRELDALIEVAIRAEEARRTGLDPRHWAKWTVSRDFWVEDDRTAYEPAAHSRSVDAALKLIERVRPNAPIIMGMDTAPWARIGAWDEPDATGAKLALALCLALLKSLSNTAGENT